MANYNSLEDMMGNRENMECLVNNSRHDDDVMQFVGVDWFKFNNTLISNIFVSGNSFIGLGASSAGKAMLSIITPRRMCVSIMSGFSLTQEICC